MNSAALPNLSASRLAWDRTLACVLAAVRELALADQSAGLREVCGMVPTIAESRVKSILQTYSVPAARGAGAGSLLTFSHEPREVAKADAAARGETLRGGRRRHLYALADAGGHWLAQYGAEEAARATIEGGAADAGP